MFILYSISTFKGKSSINFKRSLNPLISLSMTTFVFLILKGGGGAGGEILARGGDHFLSQLVQLSPGAQFTLLRLF